MGFFSSAPSIPPPPRTLPPPPPPPTPVDETIRLIRENVRRRANAAAGRGSTVATSPQGLLDEAETTKKTLLGS
jgi:hypothetical protein